MGKFVKEYNSLRVGAYVKVLAGPHKNEGARVVSIEINAAGDSWVTVRLLEDKKLKVYTGEELAPAVVGCG